MPLLRFWAGRRSSAAHQGFVARMSPLTHAPAQGAGPWSLAGRCPCRCCFGANLPKAVFTSCVRTICVGARLQSRESLGVLLPNCSAGCRRALDGSHSFCVVRADTGTCKRLPRCGRCPALDFTAFASGYPGKTEMPPSITGSANPGHSNQHQTEESERPVGNPTRPC
ncbi:g4394 [Coccomyxa viridis]|uniref:G4394 protein n=1 Tax=Coccomyxa viridis TaxID=1274662 RepID=A0ABP1FX82_9CHLO